MLPSTIEALLKEQIATDLLTRGNDEADIFKKAAAQKARSGAFDVRAHAAMMQLDEIGHRAKIIADAILKVINDVKVTPYPQLIEDLVNLYDSEFNAVVTEWKPRVLECWRKAGGGVGEPPDVDPRIDAWRTEHRMEVKRRGAAIMEPVTGGNVVSISLGPNSQVGAIQTGDHSTVGAGISITQTQSQELIQVLGDLAAMLMVDTEGLPTARRDELRELISESKNEAAKPKPNVLKLTGLLSVLWAGIKNIDKLKECGQLLKPLLHAMGINVFP